jgi:SAM-dependent methyltransferase
MKLSAKMGNISKIPYENSVIASRYNDAYILRWSVYDFMQEIIKEVQNSTVLEIGPREASGHASLPMIKIMPPFVDLGKELKNCIYKTCDMNKNIKPDYLCDVADIFDFIEPESFDAVVAMEVMEHSPRMWELPNVFYRLLKPGGRLYVSSPFYVHHHDPHPDYWRFTEEAYQLLFGKLFNIELTKILWKPDDGQRPVHFRLKGTKI